MINAHLILIYIKKSCQHFVHEKRYFDLEASTFWVWKSLGTKLSLERPIF